MADTTPTAIHSLSRDSSFQRMLELEKQYRLERLQSGQAQPDLSPSSPTERRSPRAPLQIRRAGSLSRQQQDPMSKSVQRSITPPPLSIAIPPPHSDRRLNGARSPERTREREPEPGLESVESLQESVKFLAPESDEDPKSDHSSICHSPSWEGYGQNKKKDKTKEVERKRKAKEQKEQAEREAKASKKRASSRLTKAAPMPARQLLDVAEGSNSVPLLDSYSFRTSNGIQQPTRVDGDQGNMQPASRQASPLPSVTPGAAETVASVRHRLDGKLRLQQEGEAALQYAVQSQLPHNNAADPRQRLRKSYFTGPAIDTNPLVSGGSSIRNDSKSSRESCPPSASRTPMLRHIPAQQPAAKVSRGRDTKSHPATSSYSSTPESLDPDGSSNVEGGNDGYVRRHRDQSTERALAGLDDEHLVPRTLSSSTTNTSRRTRRSSLIRDAKAAALRLLEHKGPPANGPGSVKRGSVDHGDYFNYPVPPGSPAATSASSPSGNVPLFMTYKATQADANPTKELASSNTSIQSGSAKSRSLKDVARAALRMPPSHGQVPTSKPTVKPPPYYMLRTRFSSSSPVPTVSTPMSSGTQITLPSSPAQSHSTGGPSAAPRQPAGSGASESSYSSSNYDDSSPLPSPATTPDSSRPQSSKGPPEEVGTQLEGQAGEAVEQDDAGTLRQLSGAASSGSSSADVTPRLTQYDEEGNEMSPEDRWSRTAIATDIDFEDAQSTVSDYLDAREEPVETAPAPARLDRGTGVTERQQFDGPGGSLNQPHLFQSHTDLDPRGEYMAKSSPQAHESAILPRSESREPQGSDQARMRPGGQLLGNLSDIASQKTMPKKTKEEPREAGQRQKKLRRHKPAQDTKIEMAADGNTQVVERERDHSKMVATQASTNPGLEPARLMSPIGDLVPSFGCASNPPLEDFSETGKAASTADQGTLPVRMVVAYQRQPPAPKVLTETTHSTAKVAPATRTQYAVSAPELARAGTSTLSVAGPTAGSKPASPSISSTTTPVSNLKPAAPQPARDPGRSQRPTRPPVLSAIPKHLQPPNPARRQALAAPLEPPRTAPIAKMFVECCSCRFYHDMPSKVYECMAEPDAVVEDRLRGLSGAITTMVKCPWCQHNMSTSCCAGYAAVVYIQERLH